MGALPHGGWWIANESVCAGQFQQVRVSDGREIVAEVGARLRVPHSEVSDGMATYESVALW